MTNGEIKTTITNGTADDYSTDEVVADIGKFLTNEDAFIARARCVGMRVEMTPDLVERLRQRFSNESERMFLGVKVSSN